MDQLTSVQLSEWEAYDRIDPIGTWRDDYRMAVLASLIVNIVSRLYAKKGHTPKEITPAEFMPNWSGEKKIVKAQSIEEMKSVLLSLAKTVNKKMEGVEKAKKSALIPPKARRRTLPPSRKDKNK